MQFAAILIYKWKIISWSSEHHHIMKFWMERIDFTAVLLDHFIMTACWMEGGWDTTGQELYWESDTCTALLLFSIAGEPNVRECPEEKGHHSGPSSL